MTLRVNPRSFSGAAAVFDGTLAIALQALAVNESKRCLDALNPTVLTDNSGGASADGTIGAITLPPAFTEAATASAQKAEFEASCVNVKDAITELGTKLEECFGSVPACVFAESAGGTTADNTIGAIDASMTAVNTSIAAYAGATTVCTNIRNALATLAWGANKLAYSLGVAALVDNSGGTVLYGAAADSVTIPALSTGTGTAVDGTALSGISKAGADAFLAAAAAAVKEIATKINACIAAAAAPTVSPIVKVAEG